MRGDSRGELFDESDCTEVIYEQLGNVMAMSDRKIVSPSLGLLIVLPLTILLASLITFAAFETAGVLEDEDPVADVEIDRVGAAIDCESDHQIAAIHRGGETINVTDVEISVRLLGTQRQNEIVNLPADGPNLEERNIREDGDLITDCAGGVIAGSEDEENGTLDDEVVWAEGDQIIFALDDTSQVYIDQDPTFLVEVVDTDSGDTLASEELDY